MLKKVIAVGALLVPSVSAEAARAATRCGTINAGGWRIKITREKGRFPCRDARALFRDFYNRRGVRRHCDGGRRNCPNAYAYYTIKRWPRWRVGTGAGGAAAITGRSYRKSRDYIVAEVPPQ